MAVKVEIKDTPEGRKLKAELQKLKSLEVAVGLLAESGNEGGEDGAPSVVDIALWNEYGTYAAPARPFISTTVVNYGSQIQAAIEKGIDSVVKGGTVEQACDTLGVVAKAAMQQNVVDGGFAANSPFTLTGGWMRNKKSGKPFYTEGKQSNTPLVDSGFMRGQINYVVRPKGSGGD